MENLPQKAKNAWRSKTVWFGLGVTVLLYLQGARGDVEAMLDALGLSHWKPFIWPLAGIGIILLRFVTDRSLEEK